MNSHLHLKGDHLLFFFLRKVYQSIILLLLLGRVVLAQDTPTSVSGKVINSSGDPIVGASIIERGTTNGQVTNGQGAFTLKVSGENAVLNVSSIGYSSKDVPINGKSFIEVILQASQTALDQVVVVGYGTQKKVSLTGAVSQVQGENLEIKTTKNVQQALQGKIAGLTILDEGAAPGKRNIYMRIRGVTTLSGNNKPLIIVDGIEQRIFDLNPNDIESISVLKDASSTAIYGSRAANGVILVTTKNAKSGKLAVSYHGSYSIQRTNNNPEHMGLEDYMRLQNVAWTNSTGSPIYTEEYIQKYVNATDRLKYPLPNVWYDVVISPAPQVENSFSISGGNEFIKSRLSVRYRDQQGIIANSESKVSEVRLNNDFKLSPKVNISTGVNYRYSNNLAPINEYLVFGKMLQTSQWTVPKYPDGTYGISSDGHNPLMYSEIAGISNTRNQYIIGNIKGDWEILHGLKFTTQLGAVIDRVIGKDYSNRYKVRDYYNPEIITKSVPKNSLTETRNINRQFTINNLLNYSNVFEDHYLNVLIGYSQIEYIGNNLSAYRENFYNNDIQSISAGVDDATKDNSGNEYNWGLRSYFSRVNYSYKGKYLVEVNARYDGSSRFLGDNKYSFFPSFSVGWRISEEQFWNRLGDYINEFKLRGSWGKTGNQAVELYSGLPTLDNTIYILNGTPVKAYVQRQMANQELTWETTTQTNFGLDARFFSNRMSLSVDYYNKVTKDILLELPVPSALGLDPPPQNAGRVDNEGWEFMVGLHNHFGKIGFDANINFSINHNEVIDLAGTGPYINSFANETRWITGVGYPIRGFWGYKTDGLFQTKEEIENYPTLFSGTAPGDVKYVDLNEDGRINGEDMTYLGPTFPIYTFGGSMHFTYKNFGVDLLFQGTAGQKTRLGGALIEMGIWGGFTSDVITDNYWTPENRDARFPRPLKYDLRNFHFSDRGVLDGSYFRLKNVRLSYQIPSSLTEKVHIKQVQVYVSATNLLTFAELKEWGVDPETNDGTRTEAYPQTSYTTVGVSIDF